MGRVAGVVLIAFVAVQLARDSSSRVARPPSCGEVDAAFKRNDVPAETRKAFKANCEKHGWTMVPEATAAPVVASRGCELLESPDVPTPRALPQRTVAAPARPIPYFAPRTGVLPPDGRATVAGIALPSGSRCPSYWATDAPVANPAALAARLAAKFPRTGLWPVLTSYDGETPDHYLSSVEDPANADGIDVLHVLHRLDPSVVKLAAGEKGAKPAADPFAGFVQEPGDQYALLLVPVNRPADVLSLLGGFIATRYLQDSELTAIARSWEERFGAVVTAVEIGGLDVTPLKPVQSRDDAALLALEHNAIQPDEPVELSERVRDLMTDRHWELGWPD